MKNMAYINNVYSHTPYSNFKQSLFLWQKENLKN